MIKIQGEHTRPTDAPTLCEGCSNATVVRGTRFGDDFVYCEAIGGPIRFTVASCSAHIDRSHPTARTYAETGWQWMPDIDRFMSPNEKYRMDMQRHMAAQTAPPARPWWRFWGR